MRPAPTVHGPLLLVLTAGALGLALSSCQPSDEDKDPDTSADGADGADGGPRDTGGTGGGSGGDGSGSGGDGGSGLTDNDGDGWATEQGDLDDSDASIHPGALEILGDGIDQDCDGQIDEVHLDRVGFLTTCEGARDVRLAANSSTTFASILCTQARVSMPDEDGTPTDSPTDYWDSALAFGWTHSQPGGQPTVFYDWSRNLSDPNAELLNGQALVATDEALFGAVGLRTPSNERSSIRLAGFQFAANSRFGVNYSGRDSVEGFTEVSLALGHDDVVHAVACDGSSGPPRTLLGSTTSLYASSYDAAGTVDTMGNTDVCAIHYGRDGTGTFVGEGGSAYEWSTFTNPLTLAPATLSATQLSSVNPVAVRTAVGGGKTVLLIGDRNSNRLLVEEADQAPDTATRHPRMNRPEIFSGSLAGDGTTLAVAWVDSAGDLQVEVGAMSGAAALTLSPDVTAGASTIQSFEVQLSADGSILWFAATDGIALYEGAVGL